MESGFSNNFGTVAIVGVGLIGGSIGLALRQSRLAEHVIGVGRDNNRLNRAVQHGSIDQAVTDLTQGVRNADLVILCTTVSNIIEILPQVRACTRVSTVITDVGSTKTAIVDASQFDVRFTGGHPMAGSEKFGVDAAYVELFHEAIWAVTPSEVSSARSVDTVIALAQSLGAETMIVPPEQHDTMVGVTSHLPHVMSSALMRLAHEARERHPNIKRLAAGSFADGTRVASSPAAIWRDVCLTNNKSVLAAISHLRDELDTIYDAIQQGDAAAIEAFFAAGNNASAAWKNS